MDDQTSPSVVLATYSVTYVKARVSPSVLTSSYLVSYVRPVSAPAAVVDGTAEDMARVAGRAEQRAERAILPNMVRVCGG